MIRHILTWDEIHTLADALDDLTGYVSDNSCTDPDCCDGPYFTREDFDAAERVLARYGLKWSASTQSH